MLGIARPNPRQRAGRCSCRDDESPLRARKVGKREPNSSGKGRRSSGWGLTTFPVLEVLAAIERDRASLEAFVATSPRAARQIADYLQMRRDDLLLIKETAHRYAGTAAHSTDRPYPYHLNVSATYSGVGDGGFGE